MLRDLQLLQYCGAFGQSRPDPFFFFSSPLTFSAVWLSPNSASSPAFMLLRQPTVCGGLAIVLVPEPPRGSRKMIPCPQFENSFAM